MAPTFFADTQELWAWFEANPTATELWIGFYKKGSGKSAVTYDEALDEALCFGWIDGQLKTHDELSFQRRFTPRKPQSAWSKINVGHVERLIREGRMTDAGLTQVEAARADGRWAAAYGSQRTILVPDDLKHFLDTHPTEKAFFESMTSANRYAILYRLQTARKPETRAKRITLIQEMLTAGRVFHE